MADFTFSAPANGNNWAFSFTVTGVLTTLTQPDSNGQPQTIQAYVLTGATGTINGQSVSLFTNFTNNNFDAKAFGNFSYNNAVKLSPTGDFGDAVSTHGVDSFGFVLSSGDSLYRFYFQGVYAFDKFSSNGQNFLATSNYSPASLTSDAPCYARGTRILTTRGAVAVEELREGEEVVIASGERRPIRWIGRREIDLSRHPRPRAVQPIRIAAGALGEGLPNRDLMVSPDHALGFEGGLVPAGRLVNGATIRQEAWSRVQYFHVELETHELLMAEGAPAESYLDCDNRRGFDNARLTDLHPEWRSRADSRPFLPAARCEALREAFAVRARSLGHGAELDAHAARALVARENFVRNPRGEGEAPVHWMIHAPEGLSAVWSGAGEEGGLPYVELRVTGQTADAAKLGVYPETLPAPGARGEDWTFSCGLRCEGSGLAGANLYIDELDAKGRWLGGHAYPQTPDGRRAEATHRMAHHGVAATTAYVQLRFAPATQVDLTLRLRAPQLERGDYATAPILPPPGAPGVSRRARLSCARAA